MTICPKGRYPIRGEISRSRNVNIGKAWPATDTLRFY